MIDEITDLLDIAIDREVASEAFYIAGQKKTQDPGALKLMQDLANEESRHYQWIRGLKENNLDSQDWQPENRQDLMISEYLIDTNISDGASLQDVITVALKREQYSIEFYAKMKSSFKNALAMDLCDKLILEEKNHKLKLEVFYDDFFYKED